MSKSSLAWRIVKVAHRSPGEVDIRSSRMAQSVLPSPSVSEVAEAIKFLVNFKWPALLSPGCASQTVCSMMPDNAPQQPQASPSVNTFRRMHSVKEGREEKDGGNVGNLSDWRKWRSEQGARWRESGLSPKELLGLVQLMREGGRKPSRDEYGRLLCVCMYLCERKGAADAGLHFALKEMVKRMKEDLGRAAASSVVMSSTLPVASSQAQAERIWGNLAKVPDGESEESTLHLLDAYLSVDEDSKAAVSTLMRQLAAKSIPISAHTFERVLTLCIRNSKLSQAVGTYSCMVRRYGIAPSRSIYSQLTDLLSAPSPSDAVTESLCYRILADTRAVFGGSPPLWVYTCMSKPLLKLRGLSGYKDMYVMSLKTASEYNTLLGSKVTDLLRQSWEPSLYHSLIRYASDSVDQSTTMALYLYQEMAAQGTNITEKTFELLLDLAHRKEHLHNYLTPILFEMNKTLSVDQMATLKLPLLKALGRIYDYHRVSLTHDRTDGGWHPSIEQGTPDFISLAVQLLVNDTSLLYNSHQRCLDQLARLAREQSRLNNDLKLFASNKVAYSIIGENQLPLTRALI